MGALDGIRIIEMAGLGPAPFAGMMLADHGAEVVRVERPAAGEPPVDILNRSRKVVRVDLKQAAGQQLARELIAGADGVIEGFRPGVMERLGLGPEVLMADKPSLVYGRMTGWGQSGPYSAAAGHDINYIALAGALHAFGRAGEKPTPPINMVGDFGGGGMLLAFGMVAALLSAARTGAGQVVDCAMTDGAALLMSMIWSLRANGQWSDERGTNIIDTGAPFYDVYECAGGGHVAIGSIEPQFFALLVHALGLDSDVCRTQMDRSTWPALRKTLTERFLTRTAEDWCGLLDNSDACFAPVLSMTAAPHHPHNQFRETFITVAGVVQPAPAPRFSATPAATPYPASHSLEATKTVLSHLGFDASRIAALHAARVFG